VVDLMGVVEISGYMMSDRAGFLSKFIIKAVVVFKLL
jgi:hypothetical protein